MVQATHFQFILLQWRRLDLYHECVSRKKAHDVEYCPRGFRPLSHGLNPLSTYVKKKVLCPGLLEKPQGGPETA